MPHQQLSDNAPAEIQEKLFERARSLSGVRTGPSRVSVPGARAFFMEDTSKAPADAFMIGSEFAHLHPSYDGSLHLVLPAEVATEVIDRGWGELHPMARGAARRAVPLMVFGPRNDEELEVVWLILRASFEFAGGLDEPEPNLGPAK
jgi:phospholipase/carboxylesterase